MPKEKLTPDQRRALTLRALSGESPSLLAQEYGVARSWVYALKEEAKENFKENTREVHDEWIFWCEVWEMLEPIETTPKPRSQQH